MIFLAAMAAAFGGGDGMPLLLTICVAYLLMHLGTPTLFGRVGAGVPARRLSRSELRRRGL